MIRFVTSGLLGAICLKCLLPVALPRHNPAQPPLQPVLAKAYLTQRWIDPGESGYLAAGMYLRWGNGFEPSSWDQLGPL